MRHVATSAVAGYVLASVLGVARPTAARDPGRSVPGLAIQPEVAAGMMSPVKSPPQLHASRRLPDTVRRRLEQAFDQAAQRVGARATCRALFDPLGLDARTALDFSIYYPANPFHEVTACRRAVAFSHVGAGPTRLCRRFTSLTDEQAVQVVLHEALHRAGLSECAADPNGRTSSEINSLVHRACRRPTPDLPGGDQRRRISAGF